jgi:hypothetical protein
MGNDSEHRHGPKLNRTAVGLARASVAAQRTGILRKSTTGCEDNDARARPEHDGVRSSMAKMGTAGSDGHLLLPHDHLLSFVA